MARTVQIDGADDLIKALKKLGQDGERAAAQVVQATAIEVRGDIVKRYQRGPKTGKIYQKYNPRREHQASDGEKKEAPATDTGRLANATVYKMTGKMSAEVSNDVKYGEWLEFGTQDIKPRPAWVPAVEDARPKYRKRMETALARLTR
jgi:HK97 gp10 family phage protein